MHVGDIGIGMFPALAIVGAGAPISVGAALSAKMRGTDQVSVCFFGDGGANEGAVHEAMNMAAIWRLPVLFVCENNQYGASTPVSTAFPIKDVAERAPGYAMPSEIVDGNDVVAVRDATLSAVERARSAGGPTMIECKTYRLCGHSRSDACNYRPDEEEARWRARDPLTVMQLRLAAIDPPVGEEGLAAVEADVAEVIDDAVAYADASPAPDLDYPQRFVFDEGGR